MDIGIITFSDAQNYGAMLQAYALIHYINTLGHNCALINYRKFDQRWFKPRKTFQDILVTLLLRKQGRKRISHYQEFRKKHLNLTYLCNDLDDLKELNKYFDVFITGSDQVWNCNVCMNDAFFLSFVSKHKLKIAYAPSFGSVAFSEKNHQKATAYIKKLDYVSVREKSGARLIKQLTGINAPVVLDPVFLVPLDHWIQILSKQVPFNGNFIFVYTTEVNKKLFSTVHMLSQEKKLKVISTQYISGCRCITKKDIGPLEFLQYIYHADYVLSTSFHATAFSIIFNKPFGVFLHSQTGTRVKDLLLDLHIDNRILDGKTSVSDIINWDEVNALVRKKIETSKYYLLTALEGKKNEP